MPFDYSYEEFIQVISNNPKFSFAEVPYKLHRDNEHGCSFFARIPNGSATLYFHNFDLNSSYHVQFHVIERMVLSFDLYKRKELIKDYCENKLKIKFEQAVYDSIQAGYDEYIKQIDNYIELRGGKYRSVLSMNIKICFDKETHDYLGYSMNIHTHLIYHKKKGDLSPIIHFDIHGYKDGVTYRVQFPYFTSRSISPKIFTDSIPDGTSVLQHWIGRCDGDEHSTLEEAMDGIDRIEMAVTLKEMIAI